MKSYYVIEKQTIEKTPSMFAYSSMGEVSRHKTLKSALKSLKELDTNILTFDEMNLQLKETNVVYTIYKMFILKENEVVNYLAYDYYVILGEGK